MLAVDDVLSDREAVFISLRKKLLKSQERVKATIDAHQRDVNFELGEWLMVRLRPYRQSSAAKFFNSKLAKRFYGPF